MTQHANLTGADLHELKGASSAAASTVPVANGSGSTTFQKLTTSSLDATSFFRTNQFTLSATLTDVSAPSSFYFVIPVAATLNSVYTCLQSAITLVDDTLTIKNHAGSTAGNITVAFTGSAAGDVDTVSCAANNTFTAGQVCTVTTDGASSTTAALFIVLNLTQTA